MVNLESLVGTGKIYGLRRMRRNDRRRMRRKRRRRRKRIMDLLEMRGRGGYLVPRIMGSMNGRSRRWKLC
jgi:predicted transcriptional regulator